MNIIKPKKLKKGDTISIISPSGPVDIDKTISAKIYLENEGYKVKLGKNISKSRNYLAGSDEERIEDLHEAFADKDIDAILCARGGYGALRLINKIDYNIIKNNPKIFCGYSDITVLNTVLLKKCGLVTFSGVMAQPDFSGDIYEYTIDKFFECLTENFENNYKIMPQKTINYSKNKKVSGIFWGGNLSSVVSLCGTDFIPEKPFIFFAEDINEQAYKIDKYFTQLFNINTFKDNVRGIVLGEFQNIDNIEYLNEYLYSLAAELDLPVIGGYPFTHGQLKATAPVGAKAELHPDHISFEPYLD